MKDPVTFRDITVKPGHIGHGVLTSVELTDSTKINLPIIVVNGAKDGPKFLVSGAVHGGELILERVAHEALSPKMIAFMRPDRVEHPEDARKALQRRRVKVKLIEYVPDPRHSTIGVFDGHPPNEAVNFIPLAK